VSASHRLVLRLLLFPCSSGVLGSGRGSGCELGMGKPLAGAHVVARRVDKDGLAKLNARHASELSTTLYVERACQLSRISLLLHEGQHE